MEHRAHGEENQVVFKMSPAERDADVARFDAGVNYEDTAPLTPVQRARFERAKKTPNWPATVIRPACWLASTQNCWVRKTADVGPKP